MANPQQGSGYTNLSQIIAANQQNQLGNTIQGGVQKGISGLNTNLNQAQQQFSQDVNNSNLNTTQNQNAVTNTINSIVPPQATQAPQQTTNSSTAPAPATTSNAVTSVSSSPTTSTTNPATNTTNASAPATTTTPSTSTNSTLAASTSSGNSNNSLSTAPGSFGFSSNATSGTNNTTPVQGVTPSAGQLAQFAQLLQGGYNGPTSLNAQTLANLNTQAQNLQQTGQLVNTQGGLQSLLQQYVGGNGYTSGDQNLDALILGQTGQPQLQNVLSSTQNLTNIPTQAAAQDVNLAQTTAAGNQALAQNTQSQLANAQNGILQNIANQITPIQNQDQAFDTAANQIYTWLNTAAANPTTGLATPGTVSSAPMATTPGGFATTPGSAALMGPGGQTSGTGVAGATEANPTTSQQAALDSLNLAVQAGILTPSQLQSLQPMLNNVPTTGANDLQNLLAQSFSLQSALPTNAAGQVIVPSSQIPTMQQAANSQQAAQLNALEQLGGVSPEFSTYGGAANAVAGNAGATPLGFNLNTLGGLLQQNQQAAPPTQGQLPGFGTWFCTELYNRKLINIKDLVAMSKFFITTVFKRTNMCKFYIEHGKLISDTANKYGFNWSTMKYKMIDKVIELQNENKITESHKQYSECIKEMCLKFDETKHLWNDKYLSTSFIDIIVCLPKVLTSTLFINAFKITYLKPVGKLNVSLSRLF